MSFVPPPPKYSALLILGILKALVRDGFRCIVTGIYDYRFLRESTELEQERTGSGVGASATECAHIIPQSIATISGVDDKDAKVWFADLSSAATNHAYL